MAEPVLVYILAASHSGSTLTGMLLNSHPEIHSAGELKATNLGDVQQYRCSCHAFIGDCNFWRQVSDAMREHGFAYDVREADTSLLEIQSSYVRRLLRPLHRNGPLELARDSLLGLSARWRRHYPVWRARNRALIEAVSAVAGTRFIVDSSKIGIRLKYLNRIEGLNIKVVQLIRDGRAVSLTYMNPSNYADATDPKLRGGGGGNPLQRPLSMQAAATEWRRSNEEAKEVLKAVPQADRIQIRYEDLCLDARTRLHEIHRFLGLAESDAFEQFRLAEHHVVGNGMRLDQSSEIRLDDRWCDALSRQDLLEFDRIAGQLNRSFGYR